MAGISWLVFSFNMSRRGLVGFSFAVGSIVSSFIGRVRHIGA